MQSARKNEAALQISLSDVMRIGKIIVVFLWLMVTLAAAGQTAQDPLKQIRSAVIEKIDGKDYYIHTVKRGQTLYMISKAYKVDVNAIIRENPAVKEGIRADQKLKILVPGQKPPAQAGNAGEKKESLPDKGSKILRKDTVAAADTVNRPLLPCGADTSSKKALYHVALMLPLYLGEAAKIDTVTPDPGILEKANSFRFLPYYEGFLMALDSLEARGLRIRLFVYDVGKDTAATRRVLNRPEMKSMDLIFGLLYHANFRMVAAYAKKNKINLINPISERSDLVTGNPYVFKAQPPKKRQYEQLAEYMAGAFRDGRVFIIRNGQFSDPEAPENLRKECLSRDLQVQVVEGRENAIGQFSKEKPNYVVAFSDNQAYALGMLRDIYKVRNEFDITVVGLPGWSAMEGLETEYLVTLKTHMIDRSFVDYADPAVKRFVRMYQEKYLTDPELPAFQGYDQAFYFLTALLRYGTNIGRCIGELKLNSLQTRFDFAQSKGNGFENRHWAIYKYENYKLVGVN